MPDTKLYKVYKLDCSYTFLKKLAQTSNSSTFTDRKLFKYARNIDTIATSLSEVNKFKAILVKIKYWLMTGEEFYIKIWIPNKFIEGDMIIERKEDGTLWREK